MQYVLLLKKEILEILQLRNIFLIQLLIYSLLKYLQKLYLLLLMMILVVKMIIKL